MWQSSLAEVYSSSVTHQL